MKFIYIVILGIVKEVSSVRFLQDDTTNNGDNIGTVLGITFACIGAFIIWVYYMKIRAKINAD